jgi:tRNA (guanosine-2'-O-)-methyltransferase
MGTIESKIKDEFFKIITDNKKELFTKIAAERTNHITIVLENIYQEHNASAVVRSCDCFGIQELHIIEKGNAYKVQRDIALGAGRWVDMYNYDRGTTVESDCIEKLKSRGYSIVATTPHATETIHSLPINQPMAFVFGTERRGLSEEMLALSDHQVKIPMYGFTESFNISVSVALVLNTMRARLESSNYNWKLSSEEQIDLINKWCRKILNGGEQLEAHFRKLITEQMFIDNQ